MGTGNRKFLDMLLTYSQKPESEDRKVIEKEIWDEFGAERAVLIVDMSGFSRLTLKHGVVHYLSMVRRMQLTAEPIIDSHDGIIIKFEADNCFSAFEDPLNAVRTAISLNLAFDAANIITPDELDIRIACGIDYGGILVIDEDDFFGNAVNRGSKLGEDVAGPGEILITKEAAEKIPKEAGINLEPISLSISGIQIDGFSVIYQKD